MQKQKSERCKKISNVRNILNIIKLSYQKNSFKDKNNLKQNLRQVWECFLPFVYLKSFYLIKETFFFSSESAHTSSFDVLLSLAMLLLLTASAPLQCLAAQKIWKCFDKVHPLSMRISSTESLQGHCCTQILYIDNSRLYPSATFQILLLDIVSCAS